MSKLAQRCITAIALVAVLLGALFLLPSAGGIGILVLFILVGAWEWAGFLSLSSRMARFGYAVLITALLVAGVLHVENSLFIRSVLWVALAWWVLAFFWVLRYPTPIPAPLGAVCGMLVLVPAGIALADVFLYAGNGPALVLLLLCIVWAADIGAYFTGRWIGRVKLLPQVSPGKTWEGVVGGLAAAAAVGAGGAIMLQAPVPVAVPLALGVAAVSVVGDLTVSIFKRNAGLKDSGRLFPGHGGVMDRVDGVTAAAPLFSLTVCHFGWLGL